jgi:hypothetical protein
VTHIRILPGFIFYAGQRLYRSPAADNMLVPRRFAPLLRYLAKCRRLESASMRDQEPRPEPMIPECPSEPGLLADKEWDRLVGEPAKLRMLTALHCLLRGLE